jgi:hypothetical protein
MERPAGASDAHASDRLFDLMKSIRLCELDNLMICIEFILIR